MLSNTIIVIFLAFVVIIATLIILWREANKRLA